MAENRPMIPVAKPDLSDEEAEAASAVIRSGWVTQGPEVAKFEAEFAAAVGAPYACAVSSCTTALHLALIAVGVKAGDEVITVSHSFIATANAVRYCGATPVFIDIEPTTFNLDPALLAAAVTPKTRAILCVHQIGMPCNIHAIVAFGKQHGIPVIEDAACAAGSAIVGANGEKELIGKPHGDIAAFSFHPRKLLSTGDGGMLTTRNERYDAVFRLLRQHAMSVPDTVRHGSSQVIFESYPEVGYNYRMTDIQAAIGRVQLRKLDALVSKRRTLAGRYAALLGDTPGLALPFEPNSVLTNWQSYCVRLPDASDQRAVMQFMLDRGVSTRRGIMCAHREAAYADLPLRFPLPHSERAQDRCIVLPLYCSMTDDDQVQVAGALREALGKKKAA